MYEFANDQNALNLDRLRTRLRRMADAELIRFGRACRYMCSPEANCGKPPREAFVTQLRGAVAEWHRRRSAQKAPADVESENRQ